MSSVVIAVIDIGVGNIGSVLNMLKVLGAKGVLVSTAEQLESAEKIILPGVGSFDEGMRRLDASGIRPILDHKVKFDKTPILGICLGMQLLADRSEEQGGHKGLSLIPGEVREIPIREKLRLPHIGWNDIHINKSRPLFEGVDDKSAFYFVHSYRFECDDKYVTSKTRYGSDITSSIQSNNIFGVQFHPERSQRKGLHLLDNFIKYVAEQC